MQDHLAATPFVQPSLVIASRRQLTVPAQRPTRNTASPSSRAHACVMRVFASIVMGRSSVTGAIGPLTRFAADLSLRLWRPRVWPRDASGTTGAKLLDAAGRRRSPATMPGCHWGWPPGNKGRRYPADPPTVEEIVAVMRCAGDRPPGLRTRALIVLLWRAGLRINEALDPARGSILIRPGKGGRRRRVGMDSWGWEQLKPWLEIRLGVPIGALLCALSGSTAGRPLDSHRSSGHAPSPGAGCRGAPSLRPASFAMPTRYRWHARVSPLVVIQRQHANLGITSVYLQGIDSNKIIDTVHRRPAPCSRPAPDSASRRLAQTPATVSPCPSAGPRARRAFLRAWKAVARPAS